MGLRENGRGLKQVFHKKPFKKLFLGISRLGKSPDSVAKIFASCEWVAQASGWTHYWDFVTDKSPAESWKTLILVFQHKTCLNNEKQSKH